MLPNEVTSCFSDLPPVYWYFACQQVRSYRLHLSFLLNLARQESKYEVQRRLIARTQYRLARQYVKDNGPEVQAFRAATIALGIS